MCVYRCCSADGSKRPLWQSPTQCYNEWSHEIITSGRLGFQALHWPLLVVNYRMTQWRKEEGVGTSSTSLSQPQGPGRGAGPQPFIGQRRSFRRSPGRRTPCRGIRPGRAPARTAQRWPPTQTPCCVRWPAGRRPGWSWAADASCRGETRSGGRPGWRSAGTPAAEGSRRQGRGREQGKEIGRKRERQTREKEDCTWWSWWVRSCSHGPALGIWSCPGWEAVSLLCTAQ